MDAVDRYIPIPKRDEDDRFLMAVEDVFSIDGHGTVATGHVERGLINTGDEVEIIGLEVEPLRTTCTGVETFRKILDQGRTGDKVGLLLGSVKPEEIRRGQVIAKPGSITPHSKFEAEIYYLSKDEGGRHTPFFSGYRPQFYFRTTCVTGTAKLIGAEMCMPGERVKLAVELHKPIAMEGGDRFAIREGGCTVGSGIVVATETTASPQGVASIKIRPLEDRVAVETRSSEGKTAGTLIPDSWGEKPQRGTVISIDPKNLLNDSKMENAATKLEVINSLLSNYIPGAKFASALPDSLRFKVQTVGKFQKYKDELDVTYAYFVGEKISKATFREQLDIVIGDFRSDPELTEYQRSRLELESREIIDSYVECCLAIRGESSPGDHSSDSPVSKLKFMTESSEIL